MFLGLMILLLFRVASQSTHSRSAANPIEKINGLHQPSLPANAIFLSIIGISSSPAGLLPTSSTSLRHIKRMLNALYAHPADSQCCICKYSIDPRDPPATRWNCSPPLHKSCEDQAINNGYVKCPLCRRSFDGTEEDTTDPPPGLNRGSDASGWEQWPEHLTGNDYESNRGYWGDHNHGSSSSWQEYNPSTELNHLPAHFQQPHGYHNMGAEPFLQDMGPGTYWRRVEGPPQMMMPAHSHPFHQPSPQPWHGDVPFHPPHFGGPTQGYHVDHRGQQSVDQMSPHLC
ncbi:hypothetical protein PCANC_27473 [Puccinia coronata f. sp. avenae]|uniref:RING-type domain-containing protein n=1 Tax=Puccinia coronata f. sp. avenae TaxID=200324 RepID=A0A2N5TVZ6_9BASI|nr:hypothetical protein PCANC_27473 [Puccinia coronata f. sp. avenae]